MKPAARHSLRTRSRSHRRRSLVSGLTAALLVALGAAAGVVGIAPPAFAAATVTISGLDSLDPDGESSLELSGSGFQSVENGFGGVYVLFGWADQSGEAWRPSNDGKTGEDYRYVYDDESNPTGYQVFVAFPGSSTSSAANGGELGADGSWSGTMRIPGARFTTYDRAQNETTVDCTEVQCGIITIGAHGVVNAGNETFTPIDFPGGGSDDDAAGSGEDSEAGGASAAQGSGDAAEAAPAADAPADPRTGSGEAAQAAPVTAGTLLDPETIAQQQRQQTLLTLLVAVGIVLALCLMGLSFGIGGYLAMKSLLLGVNPEALEKVRQKRDERALRAEHRRRRRVSDLRRREEIRSQRAEARNEGRKDRAAMSHTEAPGGHSAAAHAQDETGSRAAVRARSGASEPVGAHDHGAAEVAPWGSPPSAVGSQASPASSRGTYGAGSDALLKFFEDGGMEDAPQKQDASTIVLDRVKSDGEANA